MRRRASMAAGALFLALTAGLVPAAGADGPELPDHRVPGSFIVDLRDGVDPLLMAGTVAGAAGGRVAHVYDAVVGGFAFRGPDSAAEALARHPLVEQVTADVPVRKSVDRLPTGVRRIRARHENREAAHDLGVTGRGQRIAILDTGIDLDHPDLRVAQKHGRDCTGTGLNDVEGHGTHVAGTAAARVNNHGVVGVAPGAVVVPVKVLDNRGRGSISSIICGVNHLTRRKNDGNPHNDVLVGNMSFNGRGSPGHCNDGSLREAICRSVAAGVLYTASAGNSDGNVVNEFPGNYPEVVTVSALTDFDGREGRDAGCRVLFGRTECDDTLWTRNNSGGRVEVTAPGILIESTTAGGGWETLSGTSQAAPHVAGAAALIREVRPAWGPKHIRNHIMSTGECPNARQNTDVGFCRGQGRWRNDEDNFTEPLVNALWAVEPFADARPKISWADPSAGEEVSGTVSIALSASDAEDDAGTLDVEWRVIGEGWQSTSYNSSTGRYEADWDSTSQPDGVVELRARATDSAGQTRIARVSVEVVNDASTLFVDSLEGPVGTWSRTGLWSFVEDSPCAPPGYASPTRTFYFGRPAVCDYDTGGRSGGKLVSPEIDVSGLSEIQLRFEAWRRVEDGNRDPSRSAKDRAFVHVRYDGGPWQLVWRKFAEDPGCGCWDSVVLDVDTAASPGGATTMKVRWRFDAVDDVANHLPGWFVDDVVVENA